MKNPQIRKRKIIAILCIQLFILGFFIQCKTNQSTMKYGTLVRQDQNKSSKVKFTKSRVSLLILTEFKDLETR